MTKIFSKAHLIWAAGLGVILALAFTSSSFSQSIPENLQLKAPRDMILGTETLGNGDVKYAYNSGARIQNSPSRETILQAGKHGLQITNEVLEARKPNSRTFKTNNDGVYLAEFISGGSQYHKDNNNEWWQVEYATTTVDAFNQQGQVSFIGKLFGMKAMAATATSTFFPDADPETTTVDGDVVRDGVDESWSTIISGAGTSHNDTSAGGEWVVRINTSATSNQFSTVARAIYLFDTSSIGSTATVNSASLYIYGASKGDNCSRNPTIDIYTSSPASNTALANSDYSQLGSTSQTGSPISYSSWSTSGYNEFGFNSTGKDNINLSGISKFGARNANYDVSGSTPSWCGNDMPSSINGYYADATGTSQDPKLVVVYTVPTDPPTTDVQKVTKTVNESLANSAILQNDDDLLLGLQANKTYLLDGVLFASSTSVTPDIKIAYSLPVGATIDYGYIAMGDNVSSAEFLQNTASSSPISITASTPVVIDVRGTITMGASAGNVILKWAQSTANSAATTVIKGSYLRADEIQ